MEIKVRIRGAKNPFASKLLKIVEAETLLELENSEIDTEGMVRDLAGDKALVVIERKGKHSRCMARRASPAIDDEK